MILRIKTGLLALFFATIPYTQATTPQRNLTGHSQNNNAHFAHTKLHVLHNMSEKTLYLGLYIHNKQIPYINAQGYSSDDLIATIAPKGQLKIHIPYLSGYMIDTYPIIYCTDDKNHVTPLAPKNPLEHTYIWYYNAKKTAWKKDISFFFHKNKITLQEKKPLEIVHEQEMRHPATHIKPYKPYTFENTLATPVYASFYIHNQKVPYYDFRNNKSTGDHILTIAQNSKETITIPHIKNWLNNNYPIICFTHNSTELPEILSTSNPINTYNLNQETWGYFTFSHNTDALLELSSTHVTGIKAALANSSPFTIYNDTPIVIHFSLYYETENGTFKNMDSLEDDQYAVNAIKGKQSKLCKVPALAKIRLYITTDNNLLTEYAPSELNSMIPLHYYEFPPTLNNFYGSVIIAYNKKNQLTLTRGINHIPEKTKNSLKSALSTTIRTALIAKKIASALIQGIWNNSIWSSLLKSGTDYHTEQYEKICHHKTQLREASISSSSGLSEQEQLYLSHHAPYEIIDDNSKPVRIALCSSGGGYRAMIGTLGFFDGLQRMNLMRHITYNMGLSGSSWAIQGWLASREKKVETYKNALFSRASRFLNHELYEQSGEEIQHMFNQIVRDKVLYPNTPFSIISPFGSIIAQRILTIPYPEHTYLVDDKIQFADMPLCLHAALIPQKDINKNLNGFHWVEFSPYHVNIINYQGNGRIPLWAFGRQFDLSLNKSINYTHPYSLPFCLGMWGSALSASIQEFTSQDSVQSYIIPLLQLVKKNLNNPLFHRNQNMEEASVDSQKIQQLLNLALNTEQYKQLEKYEIFTNGRLRPARIASWIQSEQKFLTIIDGGIEFNLPLPPLLLPERNIDIIIINDLSGDLHTVGATELQKALLNAKNTYGIEYTIPGEPHTNVLADKALSAAYILSLLKKYDRSYVVFKPKQNLRYHNATAPLILFIPLLDPRLATQLTETMVTQKFSYSKEEAEKLYKAVSDKIDIHLIEEIKNFSKNK